MKIENSFEVPASPQDTWDMFMDVPRVVPCMPGAELTETVDDTHWKARVAVKLGPIALTFLADVTLEDVDEAAHRATLAATAREQRGRGSARATIESSLTELYGGTRVDIVTDVALTGAVAQYGRGMVNAVATQIIDDFAKCLERQLTATDGDARIADASPDEAAAPSSPPPPPPPQAPSVVSGLELTARALRSSLERRVGHIDRERIEHLVERVREEVRRHTSH